MPRPLADCAFSVPVPAACRIVAKLRVQASRLPVCPACRDSLVPLAGNLCALCGERMVAFSRVGAESGRDVLLVDDLLVNDLLVNDLLVNDLLVNDVFTAGTTISECIPVLGQAGAAIGYAAAVARALQADRIGIPRQMREAA